MSTTNGTQFRWTLLQRLLWAGVPLLVSLTILTYSPVLTGILGTVVFVLLGAALGFLSFFITGGWTLRLEVTGSEIRLRDPRRDLTVPLDRVGMLVKNGGFPFPTLWLVLRNSDLGKELPAKGIDPKAQSIIDAYLRRNPGKKLTFIPIGGGHLSSIVDFAAELKRRIPPIVIDERLGPK
jgi:uncharacterized SAM-binding protein YcdF (DUF218 family)